MKVYIALHTTPDYAASRGHIVGVYASLHAAIKALYPDRDYVFKEVVQNRTWQGPDGFGEIRMFEVGP